ncbi:hypothetical protein V1517DRAFT_85672 [Lipomyces orientalis]|uniref:Uncharacterized protein n=1 Tax=Lipomyces orientalis TaxID=1233043 RepID=A0ACC3TCL3_9ASCO
MNNVKVLAAHREAVRDLSFSPTDAKFVIASDDSTLKIWNFNEGQEERTLTGHGWDVKSMFQSSQTCSSALLTNFESRFLFERYFILQNI